MPQDEVHPFLDFQSELRDFADDLKQQDGPSGLGGGIIGGINEFGDDFGDAQSAVKGFVEFVVPYASIVKSLNNGTVLEDLANAAEGGAGNLALKLILRRGGAGQSNVLFVS